MTTTLHHELAGNLFFWVLGLCVLVWERARKRESKRYNSSPVLFHSTIWKAQGSEESPGKYEQSATFVSVHVKSFLLQPEEPVCPNQHDSLNLIQNIWCKLQHMSNLKKTALKVLVNWFLSEHGTEIYLAPHLSSDVSKTSLRGVFFLERTNYVRRMQPGKIRGEREG